MEEVAAILAWRVTWWLIRILWLPALVIGLIAYIVVPALISVGQFLITPDGLFLLALLFAWFFRPRRRRRRG